MSAAIAAPTMPAGRRRCPYSRRSRSCWSSTTTRSPIRTGWSVCVPQPSAFGPISSAARRCRCSRTTATSGSRVHPVFAPPYRQSGPVDALYSSGNLLIGRNVLTAMGAPFPRPALQLHGRRRFRFPQPRGGEGIPSRMVRRGPRPGDSAGAPAGGRLDPLAQPAQRRHLDPGREEEAGGLARSAICASSPRAWRCSPPRRCAASCAWPAPARRRTPSIPSMSRWAACLPNSVTPMSSIGSLKRTESGWLAEAFPAARVATVLAAILLTTVIVSFRPFQPGGAEPSPEGGGDIVNQLGFSIARRPRAVRHAGLRRAAGHRGVLQPVVAAAARLLRAFGRQRRPILPLPPAQRSSRSSASSPSWRCCRCRATRTRFRR